MFGDHLSHAPVRVQRLGVACSREVMDKVMIVRNHTEDMERCPIDRRCPRLLLLSSVWASPFSVLP